MRGFANGAWIGLAAAAVGFSLGSPAVAAADRGSPSDDSPSVSTPRSDSAPRRATTRRIPLPDDAARFDRHRAEPTPAAARLTARTVVPRTWGYDGEPCGSCWAFGSHPLPRRPTTNLPSPTAAVGTANAVGTARLFGGLTTFGDVKAFGDVNDWVETFANFYPWWSGSLLPQPVRKLLFHSTPVANPMQVELNLSKDVASQPIPFTAYDPDGKPLKYWVPEQGKPGGPDHGTVTVDNKTGAFTYTPDEDFMGTDTFSFVATDRTRPHLHAWANVVNGAFGLLNTSLDGGHRVTATVTVFNKVADGTDITGDFSFLTYNISDLLGPLSRFAKTLRIGSRINGFDVVNVQEDVSYHPFLLARSTFPDQTPPSVPTWSWPVGLPFSDGLNSFSSYYIESLDRQGWTQRPSLINPGGFTYSRQHIPGGSSVDVYNVDATRGTFTNDELAQLSGFIAHNSVGRAVIVTGDFGQFYSDPGQTLTQFAAANALTDAWVQVEYGGITPLDAAKCAYADTCEQPDKVFYRNAAPLDGMDPTTSPIQLRALSYANEGLNFLTGAGKDLSSYRPQSVVFGYSVDAVGPMNVDLANWMADLPSLADLPLTQLPIPGTHDSGSYGITRTSAWALTGKDQFGILTELPRFLQNLIVKPIAAAWGKTQANNLYDQFSDGIRYVDLRLTNEPDGQIYLEHGLHAEQLTPVIDDIAAFADSHPKEALIVYVQGIKNFTPQTHAAVVAQMEAAFGNRMVPRSVGTSATLADLWEIDKNVIVVYNDSGVVDGNENLWPDDTLWRPWPNHQSVQRLLGANETNLANRPAGSIWGMFGEPTPDTTSIATGVLTIGPRSNKEFMWNVHAPVQQWMRVNFKESVNLVTADWYNVFWPAGTTFARDNIGAVYETLGSRLSGLST